MIQQIKSKISFTQLDMPIGTFCMPNQLYLRTFAQNVIFSYRLYPCRNLYTCIVFVIHPEIYVKWCLYFCLGWTQFFAFIFFIKSLCMEFCVFYQMHVCCHILCILTSVQNACVKQFNISNGRILKMLASESC